MTTTETTETDVVPSITLGVRNDQYKIATESNGCVLSNEVTEDDLAVHQNTYNIEQSNGTVIGPVTHFHCPVTIIQQSQEGINHPKTNSEKLRGEIEKSCDHQSNGTQSPRSTSTSKRTKFHAALQRFKTRRKLLHIVIIAGVTLTTIVFVIALVVTLSGTETTGSIEEEVVHPKDKEPNFNASEPQLIPRQFWGARAPLSTRKLQTPVRYVVVAHTGSGSACETVAECSSVLQSLQSYAVDHESPDIGYNFLVGGDGNIYVGRGWDAINYLQNHCISVAFIGEYTYDPFTLKMQQALKDIIQMGIEQGKILEEYTLLSHSQTSGTMSPGRNIRNVIKQWPHYYTKDYIELPD